ncbi:MAG: YlmH/Sll1252 family protein [Defluviitaleaceae bacterium]|nr:YlmH/Sll1252 family protein [Defluviitaleaceae bacterium]
MFNPFKEAEDKLQFAKLLDRLTAAQKKHQPTFSDFLDPARCAAFLTLLEKHAEILPKAQGGHENAERKMIGFIPEFLEDSTFPITPIAITYNEKFSKAPTHRDYLGAILGLGLDRGKIGDILLGESGAILYTSNDIVIFICEYLTQVGRVSVKADTNQTILGTESTGIQCRITVPSMRLDAVLGAAFNISRGKASALIDSDKVFVNWKPTKKTHIIATGDAITVRGLGRVFIDSVEGNTRKDRIVLKVTKL